MKILPALLLALLCTGATAHNESAAPSKAPAVAPTPAPSGSRGVASA